jgi:hypothetical protein
MTRTPVTSILQKQSGPVPEANSAGGREPVITPRVAASRMLIPADISGSAYTGYTMCAIRRALPTHAAAATETRRLHFCAPLTRTPPLEGHQLTAATVTVTVSLHRR